MQTILYYLNIYSRCSSQYIIARMQYRADFIISTIGMLFTSISTIFVFRILFTSIPNLVGWTFNEILLIYAFYLLSITPLQIMFDNIWSLRYDVTDGSFTKYYLRPVNIMFYYMSQRVDIKGFPQLTLGLAVLIYASHQLAIEWNLSRVFLLLIVLLSSSLVAISIFIIAASTAFWFLGGSMPILNLAIKIRDFSPYPITIFDSVFRFLFTYLIPIGFIAFYPAQLFLKGTNAPFLAYLSPLIGFIFFMLAYQVWSKGVDYYSGTGS